MKHTYTNSFTNAYSLMKSISKLNIRSNCFNKTIGSNLTSININTNINTKGLKNHISEYSKWANNIIGSNGLSDNHTYEYIKQTEHFYILKNLLNMEQKKKLDRLICRNDYLLNHLIGYYIDGNKFIKGYHFIEQLIIDNELNNISNIDILEQSDDLMKLSFCKIKDGVQYTKTNSSFLLKIDFVGYLCLAFFSHINSLNDSQTNFGKIICPVFMPNGKIKTFYLK
jgi:hypothetical protein